MRVFKLRHRIASCLCRSEGRSVRSGQSGKPLCSRHRKYRSHNASALVVRDLLDLGNSLHELFHCVVGLLDFRNCVRKLVPPSKNCSFAFELRLFLPPVQSSGPFSHPLDRLRWSGGLASPCSCVVDDLCVKANRSSDFVRRSVEVHVLRSLH